MRNRHQEEICSDFWIAIIAVVASIVLGVCVFLAINTVASRTNYSDTSESSPNQLQSEPNQSIIKLQNVNTNSKISQKLVPIDIETSSTKKPIELIKVSLARKGRLLRRQMVGLNDDNDD